jgi:mono/diheme cytochrome c family protein
MIHSQAYETYSPNPNFPDSSTMQAPVEGTIPRGMTPYPYEKNEKDLELAGKTFKNPIEPSDGIVKKGEMLFERYCIYCHGEQGKGKGNLITSGKYNVPPRDLTSEKIRNYKDGEIYHVITVGYGVMGAHGTIIQQDDRWKIIHYIREELQKAE